jgi:hypothetical protein
MNPRFISQPQSQPQPQHEHLCSQPGTRDTFTLQLHHPLPYSLSPTSDDRSPPRPSTSFPVFVARISRTPPRPCPPALLYPDERPTRGTDRSMVSSMWRAEGRRWQVQGCGEGSRGSGAGGWQGGQSRFITSFDLDPCTSYHPQS